MSARKLRSSIIRRHGNFRGHSYGMSHSDETCAFSGPFPGMEPMLLMKWKIRARKWRTGDRDLGSNDARILEDPQRYIGTYWCVSVMCGARDWAAIDEGWTVVHPGTLRRHNQNAGNESGPAEVESVLVPIRSGEAAAIGLSLIHQSESLICFCVLRRCKWRPCPCSRTNTERVARSRKALAPRE